MGGNATYTRGDVNVRCASAADAQARNVTHLCVHARGNTRAPIHGESIDIHAESELRECTSSTQFNSYPACNESSSNLVDSSFLSSFVIFIFFLFSYIFVLLSLCTPYSVVFFRRIFLFKRSCTRYQSSGAYTRFFKRIRISEFDVYIIRRFINPIRTDILSFFFSFCRV